LVITSATVFLCIFPLIVVGILSGERISLEPSTPGIHYLRAGWIDGIDTHLKSDDCEEEAMIFG
jgi:hypothetical protein